MVTAESIKDEPLTDRQVEFLLDIGAVGREVFAPNPSTMRALRKRGLIATRFIGMRWWWAQPTAKGRARVAEILNTRNPERAA